MHHSHDTNNMQLGKLFSRALRLEISQSAERLPCSVFFIYSPNGIETVSASYLQCHVLKNQDSLKFKHVKYVFLIAVAKYVKWRVLEKTTHVVNKLCFSLFPL